MSVDAVIFDWGGTLTPWHTVDLTEQWRVYARVVAPGDVEAVTAALVTAESRAWQLSRSQNRSSALTDVLRAAGVEYDDRAVAAFRAYWEPHTYLDRDAPHLLRELRERDVRVGVLSNTIWPRAWHEDVFARDGVLDAIDGAVYTSEIDHTKPHAEAFRAALAAVGCVDPARCLFVGDRPYDDISGAHAVGMRAIFVPHSTIPADQQVPVDVEPDAVVQRLAEVLPLVDGWRAQA